jgi:hypothetical protein
MANVAEVERVGDGADPDDRGDPRRQPTQAPVVGEGEHAGVGADHERGDHGQLHGELGVRPQRAAVVDQAQRVHGEQGDEQAQGHRRLLADAADVRRVQRQVGGEGRHVEGDQRRQQGHRHAGEDGDAAAERFGVGVDLAAAGPVDEPDARGDCPDGECRRPGDGEADRQDAEDGPGHRSPAH